VKLLLATALALLLAAQPASAAVFNVNTTADNGTCDDTTCSLRGALISASRTKEGDTINLVDLSGAPYQVSQGQLTVPADVGIFGLGADLTTIAGDGKSSRVFRVLPGAQVRFANLTIAKGAALADTDPFGGNVLVESGGNLLLEHVRITQGVALRGGGIAARGGMLEISHSLIDGNEARASSATTAADGGGILSAPVGSATPGVETLTISDSTIAFNKAGAGAGIMVRDNPNGATTLTRVTVAQNTASANLGGGLGVAGSRAPDIAGSILAANLGRQLRTGGSVLSNCAGVAPVDGGGNLESGTDCGFTRSGSRQTPNTGLAAALVNDGGMLPVLPISADSPARDLAGTCTGTDQRDVTRPQGALCDAGAYEYLPPPPPPPEPTPTATAQPTVSPTPTPSATPTPVPTPVVNKTVVARKVSGKVLVRVPGSRRFVEVDAALGIPVGSTVDTRKGVVELTSQPKPGAPAQTALFYDGIFKVTQKRGITDLKLTEKLARCTRQARAAAKRPKTRRLWGDGKGAFRTTGRYSAATVRGTKWLVQDSCAGTLTRVARGAVTVRDTVRKRTKVVRAGKSYRARPKR
jgi:hypothetical protein